MLSPYRRISGRWPDKASTRTTTGNITENRPLTTADSLVVHPQTYQSPSPDHTESRPLFYATYFAAARRPGCEWEQYCPNRRYAIRSPSARRGAYPVHLLPLSCQHAPHLHRGAIALPFSMRTSSTASSTTGSQGLTLMVQKGMLHIGIPPSIISHLINYDKQMTTGTL